MDTKEKKRPIKGGEFLIRETEADEIFIPEEWTEEQKMIIQSGNDFLDKEVMNRLDEIDSQKDPEMMPGLLRKAGELGFLGISLPEEYNGIGMDFNTSMLVNEVMGRGHSFVVAFSAHTGIGTLPILYYGNEEQKAKYLPKLATGEWTGAYCLTEPNSGSDANAAKTKATLSEDGKYYILNGQKMWTTNGGFADVLTVFAKIDDDDKLSAFIVEKGYEGITMNPEEHKMGIKGSSTRQIFFNDCKVPVENLLYERGKGFKMALNILNIGRIKLGAATIGGSKHAVNLSVQYANERKQFGQTIGSFGAIKHKLGDVTASIFACESALYRTTQNIEDKFNTLLEEGEGYSQAKLKSAEEFAIECAIMKVHGSEVLDYAVDEAVQIYGGMGFSAEAPVERGYRDARINRIFEGTNEINRLLTISMLMRRAMRGQIDLISPAMAVAKELTSIPDFGEEEEGLFAKEKKVLSNLKKAGLMISGAAIQKLQDKLRDEQEIIMSLSDMLIEGYTAESTLLRVEKIIKMKGEEAGAIYKDLAMVYLHKAIEKSIWAGKQAIYAFAEGDEMRMMLMGLKRFTKIEPYNLKDARRRIANYLLEKNKYAF